LTACLAWAPIGMPGFGRELRLSSYLLRAFCESQAKWLLWLSRFEMVFVNIERRSLFG
jgi:hypothetical protein